MLLNEGGWVCNPKRCVLEHALIILTFAIVSSSKMFRYLYGDSGQFASLLYICSLDIQEQEMNPQYVGGFLVLNKITNFLVQQPVFSGFVRQGRSLSPTLIQGPRPTLSATVWRKH